MQSSTFKRSSSTCSRTSQLPNARHTTMHTHPPKHPPLPSPPFLSVLLARPIYFCDRPRSFTIPCLHTSCALHLDHECSLVRTRRYYRRFGKRSSPRSCCAIQPNPRSMTYPSPTPHQSTRVRQQFGEETQKMGKDTFLVEWDGPTDPDVSCDTVLVQASNTCLHAFVTCRIHRTGRVQRRHGTCFRRVF
jgi:hypothetical protein